MVKMIDLFFFLPQLKQKAFKRKKKVKNEPLGGIIII